jgi:short-subunit dehydrogenase
MYNKKVVFFCPSSKEVSDHQGALFSYPHVDMRFVRIAAMPVLNQYAKKWAKENNAQYLPLGLKDVPIVTAGLVAFGLATDTPNEIDSKLFQVNYRGPRDLLVALQSNLANSEGAFVLNVTGIVAQMPLPSMSSYSASKLAMHGFLTAVAREWRRSGIKVVSELLGHTETGLATREIAGQAPQFPQGLSPADAVAQMLKSLES